MDVRGFLYSDLANVRTLLGVTPTDVPDSKLLEIIRSQSAVINRYTGQWFTPIDQIWKINGSGTGLLSHGSDIPIAAIRNIKIDYDASRCTGAIAHWYYDNRYPLERPVGIEEQVEAYDYELSSDFRAVQLSCSFFPEGARNIWLDGILGYWDGYPHSSRYFQSESATLITSDMTSVVVSAITDGAGNGFNVGDLVQLVYQLRSEEINTAWDAEKGSLQAELSVDSYITAIDTVTKEITIETVGTVPSSAKDAAILAVKTFGPPPRPIVDAVRYLCRKNWKNYVSETIGETGFDDPASANKLKSEKTDNYQYTYFSPKDLYGDSQSTYGNFTGDKFIDMLLEDFFKPLGMIAI